jgi:hypothetical protein
MRQYFVHDFQADIRHHSSQQGLPQIKSNNALQNLSLLHHSFDTNDDEAVILSLALNDSISAMVFGAD